tara:strand:+ start:1071 stop:1478 length:408 start_codon:yes stop_codon:yes gene_type:complete
MEEEILNLIMVHLSYLDHLRDLTEKLQKSFHKNDLESLYSFSLNRERLLKVVQTYENKILKYCSINNIKTLRNFIIEIIKEWKKESSLFLEKLKEDNKNLIEQLIKTKKDIKKDLSNIFKMNQFHGAYLTHSLKL